MNNIHVPYDPNKNFQLLCQENKGRTHVVEWNFI